LEKWKINHYPTKKGKKKKGKQKKIKLANETINFFLFFFFLSFERRD